MTIVATFRCLLRLVVCRCCSSDVSGKLKKVFQPVFTKFNVKTLNVSWNYCCQKFQFCPFEFNYYFILLKRPSAYINHQPNSNINLKFLKFWQLICNHCVCTLFLFCSTNYLFIFRVVNYGHSLLDRIESYKAFRNYNTVTQILTQTKFNIQSIVVQFSMFEVLNQQIYKTIMPSIFYFLFFDCLNVPGLTIIWNLIVDS